MTMMIPASVRLRDPKPPCWGHLPLTRSDGEDSSVCSLKLRNCIPPQGSWVLRVVPLTHAIAFRCSGCMDLLLGALLFLGGAAVTLWSVHVAKAATPDRPISHWRPTLRRPTLATLLQVVGIALSLASAFLVLDALGPFAALAPALVGTAWMVAVVAHNRQVEQLHARQDATAE
jgi:hypothetical protein